MWGMYRRSIYSLWHITIIHAICGPFVSLGACCCRETEWNAAPCRMSVLLVASIRIDFMRLRPWSMWWCHTNNKYIYQICQSNIFLRIEVLCGPEDLWKDVIWLRVQTHLSGWCRCPNWASIPCPRADSMPYTYALHLYSDLWEYMWVDRRGIVRPSPLSSPKTFKIFQNPNSLRRLPRACSWCCIYIYMW